MEKVAHCMIWYLPLTMGYVHDELLALRPDWEVVFATQEVNPERYPFDPVYVAPSAMEVAQMACGRFCITPPFHRLWHTTVREEHVTALHVTDGRIAPAFLPLAHHFDMPIVTTFLGRDCSADLDNTRYSQALRRLFQEGDLFRALSQDMARQLQRLGCPEEKIRVIHQGIPLERYPFLPRHAPERRPVIILTAGRLIPKKGPDDLARAFVLLCRRHSNVCLQIAGDGYLRPEIEAILSEGGVRDRVQFLGPLEPVELAAQMRQAHLFCLPSRVGPNGDSEGIPNVVKEAMATGLPVVSTFHAGIPELVDDDVSGYLVPERDVPGLVDRLSRLLEDPERWEVMGRAGRVRVEADYSMTSVARKLDEEIYRPLLGRSFLPQPAQKPHVWHSAAAMDSRDTAARLTHSSAAPQACRP